MLPPTVPPLLPLPEGLLDVPVFLSLEQARASPQRSHRRCHEHRASTEGTENAGSNPGPFRAFGRCGSDVGHDASLGGPWGWRPARSWVPEPRLGEPNIFQRVRSEPLRAKRRTTAVSSPVSLQFQPETPRAGRPGSVRPNDHALALFRPFEGTSAEQLASERFGGPNGLGGPGRLGGSDRRPAA